MGVAGLSTGRNKRPPGKAQVNVSNRALLLRCRTGELRKFPSLRTITWRIPGMRDLSAKERTRASRPPMGRLRGPRTPVFRTIKLLLGRRRPWLRLESRSHDGLRSSAEVRRVALVRQTRNLIRVPEEFRGRSWRAGGRE